MTDYVRKKDTKFAKPTLYLDPETSDYVAQLRKIYADQGRQFTSFAQVVKDALFYYWQHMVEVHGRPENYEEFKR